MTRPLNLSRLGSQQLPVSFPDLLPKPIVNKAAGIQENTLGIIESSQQFNRYLFSEIIFVYQIQPLGGIEIFHLSVWNSLHDLIVLNVFFIIGIKTVEA